MTYCKYIETGSGKTLAARTHERANILVSGFYNKGANIIIERNIWRDEDGSKYVQWKRKFYKVYASSDWEYSYAF